MSEAKKTPIILKDIGSPNEIIGTIEPLLEKSDPQELIYIQLDPSKYPNRLNSLSMDVRKYLMTHPRVKVEWSASIIQGKNNYDWDVVVSMTSFPNRFCQFDLFRKCLDSIVEQKTKYRFHFVITLFKDDIPKMSNEFIDYCFQHNIEILPCQEDLKGHKKYFYVMQKYAGLPLIVVDDDLIFFDNLVQDLMDKYQSYKNVIWTGWCQVMNLSDDGRLVYNVKLKNNLESEVPSFRYKFGSGSGTLIPEYMIDDFDYVLKLIHSNDNVYHDELILKKISMDKEIKVGLCKNKKYKCNIGGWLTPTQFIYNEIQPLVETFGNLHTINCSKVVVGGKTVYRGMNTEMSLLCDYVIKDDFCMLIKNQNEV